MYSVPPSQPADPVRWPRTLLLPPRHRPLDRQNLGVRLFLVLLQTTTTLSMASMPFQRALLWSFWATLLLGPTAELLPVAWQRLASVLRIFQLVAGIVTGAGVLWWWLGS